MEYNELFVEGFTKAAVAAGATPEQVPMLLDMAWTLEMLQKDANFAEGFEKAAEAAGVAQHEILPFIINGICKEAFEMDWKRPMVDWLPFGRGIADAFNPARVGERAQRLRQAAIARVPGGLSDTTSKRDALLKAQWEKEWQRKQHSQRGQSWGRPGYVSYPSRWRRRHRQDYYQLPPVQGPQLSP